MSVRYKGGCLRCVRRKIGSWCWEFLWRENGPLGLPRRRTLRLGSVEEFPTRELAANAVSALRLCINAERHRRQRLPIQMSELIDHYIETELSAKASWHSVATRIIYREFFELWIRPAWSTTDIRDVRTVAVEAWLCPLHRNNHEQLSNLTRGKIRSLMSVLFNHAIRYEWLEQGKNPIKFVRQSAERPRTLKCSKLLRLRVCYTCLVHHIA